MSSFYRNHIVTGTHYKPLLHKKGKRWIVLGLSALSLMGLGAVSSTNINANASSITPKQNQNKVSQQPVAKQPSTNSISNQADALHAKIVSNQDIYQHNNVKSSSAPLLKIANTGYKSVSSTASSSAEPASKVSASSVSSANQTNLSSSASNKVSSNASLSAIQTSFANRVNNKGMTGLKVSAVQSSFANDVNSKGMSGVSVASNNNAVSSASISTRPVLRLNATREPSESHNLQASQPSAPQVTIKVTKHSSNGQTTTSDITKELTGRTGMINPSDYQPDGYYIDSSDQAVDYNPSNIDTLKNISFGYSQSVTPKAVKDRIHFLNKSNHTIVGARRGIFVTGNKGSQYTIQSSQVPQGYKLVNDGTQSFKLDGHNHIVFVMSVAKAHPHYIPIHSKTVDFTGTIALHYHDGSKTLKDIDLPYDIKTKNNYILNDLLNNTNPSATIPTDYLNKVINRYNTANYTYDNNVKRNEYSNIAVDPKVNGWTNQNTNNPIFHNGTITLNFSANNVNENIHYDFNGHNEGDTVFSGKNNEQGKDSDAQGLHKGYHINPTNPHNTWTYGNGGSDASGQYNDSDNVNVLPNKDTDNIEYQYKGNQLASDKVTGNDQNATDAGDTTYDVTPTNHPNMPSDYHLANKSDSFSFNNGNHIVPILPDQATDTINYQNGNQKVGSHQFTGNNAGAKNASDTHFDINNTNATGLPAGYQLVNKDNQFNYDNGTHTVAVVPSKDTDTVDYQYKGTTKGTNRLTGNTSTAKGASDTTFDVTPQSDKGMPTGYHLVNSDNKFSFNGTTHNVAITPDHVSDTINYQYDNQTMSSHRFGGNTDTAQGASDTSFDINKNNEAGIPTGYHLVSKDNNFNYDNQSHNVEISPDQATDTIDYDNGNQKISSQTFTGDNSQAQGAKNSTIDITPTNDKGLPQGYHLANNDNKFNYDGNTHVVHITPNTVTDTINYQYNNQTVGNHQFTGNDSTAQGASDTTFDINGNNDAGLPNGYHLANKDNNFNYDNGTHNVIVEPNTATDIVDYNYGNKTLGNHDFSGNTSTAKNASDTTFDVNASNDQGIPTGYHLVNKDNNFKYDGTTHAVSVAPNRDTNTVDYIVNNDKSHVLGNNKFTGNDHTAKDASDTTFTVNSTTATGIPRGYHLVTPSTTFNYDNSTNYVEIAKNTGNAQVHYVAPNGEQIPASDDNGGNGYIHGSTNSDINPASQVPIPKGYTPAQSDLVNPDKPYDPNTNPIKNYHFGPQNGNMTNPSDTIHVVGNRIQGKAKVHLIYKETNGTIDKDSDAYVPINGRVGDSDIDISSWDYASDNYDNSNNPSDWYVPMDWKQAQNGDNLNYNPSHTFTYVAQSGGDVKVNYVDTDQGAQAIDGEQTDSDGQPIVSTQDLGNQGVVGTQVQLGMIGANDGNGVKDILQIPTGFFLNHKINPITVDITQGGTVVNVGLGASNPLIPRGIVNINK